jgi:hypothetical protein
MIISLTRSGDGRKLLVNSDFVVNIEEGFFTAPGEEREPCCWIRYSPPDQKNQAVKESVEDIFVALRSM